MQQENSSWKGADMLFSQWWFHVVSICKPYTSCIWLTLHHDLGISPPFITYMARGWTGALASTSWNFQQQWSREANYISQHQIAKGANRFLRTFCQSHGNDFTWPRGQTWSLTGLTPFCYWGTDVAQGRSPTAEKSILERAVMGYSKKCWAERCSTGIHLHLDLRIYIVVTLWEGMLEYVWMNEWMNGHFLVWGLQALSPASCYYLEAGMAGKCLINHDRSELERSWWFPFDERVCD